MTNEITPQHTTPEQNSSLIPPNVQEFLEDATRDYYQSHAEYFMEFTDPYESLGICAGIIHQAFQLGKVEPEQMPRNKTEARAAVKRGLDYRHNFLKQARALFSDSDSTEMKDHAISPEAIHAARTELNNKDTITDFPAINTLFSTIEERKALLPEISTNILTFFIQNLPQAEQNQIATRVHEPAVQSMLVRGIIFSIIGRLNNVDINPLFISDQNLKDLQTQTEGKDLDRFVDPIVAELTRRIAGSQPEDRVSNMLTDYGNQVAQMFKTWINIQKNDQFNNEDYRYWQKRNKVLERLPIISLIPDVDYIDTKENLPTAIRKKLRHVWQNPERINGYILPSLSDLTLAEKMYYEAGMSEDDPKFVRIKQAIQASRSYQSKNNYSITSIKTLERTLENLHDFFDQTDNSIFSVTRSPGTIHQEIHEIELQSRRSERANKQDKENRMLLEEIEQLQQIQSPEAQTRIKALIFSKLHDRQVRSYNRQAEILKEKLYMPGWKSFFTLAMGGNYQNQERIHQELAIVQNYIKEMKQDEDKILPDDYTADPDLLQKFIISEMSALYNDLDQKPNTNLQHKKYIDMAKKMGLKGNLQWKGFRSLFLNSMKKSQYQLQDLIILNNKKKHIADDLNDVNTYLETGEEQEDTQQILASIDEKKVDDTIKELKLQILPQADLAKIDKDLITQAQEIARLYRGTHGQIQFRFPERIRIDSFLREKNLVVQRGKGVYVREFLTQLQYMTHSPFFPIQYAENTSLKLVMAAFNARLNYAEYMLLKDERDKDLEIKKEELSKAKQKKEWSDKKEHEMNTKNKITYLKSMQRSRQHELIETLSQLNFVIPEKEFEELNKK